MSDNENQDSISFFSLIAGLVFFGLMVSFIYITLTAKSPTEVLQDEVLKAQKNGILPPQK